MTSGDNGRHALLAIDTSTDMLACAVARWEPPAATGAAVAAAANVEPVASGAGSPAAPAAATSAVGATGGFVPSAVATPRVLASGDHLCRRRSNVELVDTALETLASAGLAMGDVGAVVVGRGPGSFTGVRIGIATAKGLACGLGVALIGVSTLDAAAWAAWAAGARGTVGVVGDAMRGEVYPGVYQVTDAGVTRTFASETVAKAADAVSAWATTYAGRLGAVTLTGDGLKRYRAAFEEAGFSSFVAEESWYPTGEGLLRAAYAAGMAATAPVTTTTAATVIDAAERAVVPAAGATAATTATTERPAAGIAAEPAAGATAVAATPTAAGAATPAPASTAVSVAATEQSASTVTPAAPVTEPVAAGDPALVLPIYTRLSDAEESERARLGLAAPASAQVTGVADTLANAHVQLRPAGVNDVAAMAALEVVAHAGMAHTPWSQAMLYDEVVAAGHLWWVAHDAGTVVGFAGATMAGDECEVTNVAVAPQHRREGIATRLLARVCYDAQVLNASTASLEVDAGNVAAQALYEGMGFAEVARRRNYYAAGHDALVMRASLPLAVNATRAGERPEPRPSVRPWPIMARPRSEAEREAVAAAGPLVLAIESSCDETAMAVIDGSGAILANVVATQIDFHARFGGVVPEIASRKHTEAIVGVFEEAMARAGERLGVDTLMPHDLAAVGVTAGPGLVGALVVGVAFAKGLCAATGLPLVPVHHLEGHLLANLFATPNLEPPFVASLVSGGNTMLVHVRDWGRYEILGTTIDDAVGEAFDKVAKALGLGYPGGPVISRLAAEGNPRAISFPRAMLHSGDYRFSLSGLKTAVITYIERENAAGRPVNVPDLAASFTAAVVDVQVAKAVAAVEEAGVTDFCLGGGVAANPQLRAAYEEAFGARGVRVTAAPLVVCGDNAAMIAVAALRNLRAGVVATLSLDAEPNAPLGMWTSAAVRPQADAMTWPSART